MVTRGSMGRACGDTIAGGENVGMYRTFTPQVRCESGARSGVNGTLTAARSALGNTEEVSVKDTSEISVGYARGKFGVNVIHSTGIT